MNTVKYTNPEHTQIVIDDQTYLNWPSNTHWDAQVQAWIAEGNTIEPYVDTTDYKKVNAQKARQAQVYSVKVLSEDDALKLHNIARRIDDQEMNEHEVYVHDMATVEADPPDTPDYEPPLPPGVTIPDDWQFKLTIIREPGWNDVLGWRAVITEWKDDKPPHGASMAVHSAENCGGFLFTTGAFQQSGEGGDWYALCPAGHEPGDVDVFFGVLYAAVSVECKTLPAGQTSMEWEVN